LSSRLLQSFLANAAAVLTLIGIAIFCVLQTANAIFYSHFGVSAEALSVGLAETLSRQASPTNVVALILVVALALIGTRLIASSKSEVNNIRRSIGESKDEISQAHATICAVRNLDAEAERRKLTTSVARRELLETQLKHARVAAAPSVRNGILYLVAAGLVFLVWSTIILASAALSTAEARDVSWYDLFRVGVDRAAVLDTGAAMPSRARAPVLHADWLFLGTTGTNVVLYDIRSERVAILPESAVGLVVP
jgi:hypothetical protein